METDRGVMYWNMEIDPEEVNRRMVCYLCDREEATVRAFAESQRIFDIEVQGNGVRAGEVYLIAASRGSGKSMLDKLWIGDLGPDPMQPEAVITPPKNKPHYRQIGRGNRF